MIKLLLSTEDLSVFFNRAWHWLGSLSRTWHFAQAGWMKNSHACCSFLLGKPWYSLRCCQWYRYLSKPDQYFQSNLFSHLFPTRKNQGQGWSKLSWYTCDTSSSWWRNLSNSTLLPHNDRFRFHLPILQSFKD